MSNENEYNVRAATARLGGLSAYGKTPSPEVAASARATLATARIDREIRESISRYGELSEAQVGHLVGLLIGMHHLTSETVAEIEQAVRAAIREAQGSDA